MSELATQLTKLFYRILPNLSISIILLLQYLFKSCDGGSLPLCLISLLYILVPISTAQVTGFVYFFFLKSVMGCILNIT